MTCNQIKEDVYSGKDNVIILSLTVDDVPILHTLITRCQLQVGATLLDSEDNPEYFNFMNPDKLILILGDSDLPVGSYRAELSIYDPGHINGQFWDYFNLTVH